MKYDFFFMVEKLVVNVLIYKDGFRLQIVRNLDFCKAKENGSIAAKEFFNQNHKSKFNHQYLSKKWLSCKKPFMKLASSGKP